MSTALLRSKSAPHALVDQPQFAAKQQHPHQQQQQHRQPHYYAYGNGYLHVAGADRNAALRNGKSRAHMKAQLTLTRVDVDVLTIPTLTSDAGGRKTPLSATTPSPLDAPREDPFSLAGFFPSRPGSPHTPTTAWASGELDDAEERVDEVIREEEEEEKMFEKGASPRRVLSLSALDEYAKSVIAEESAVGILRLGR